MPEAISLTLDATWPVGCGVETTQDRLSPADAVALYRDSGVQPSFTDWYTSEHTVHGNRLATAMPLALLLMLHADLPVVEAMLRPPAIEVRVARALGFTGRYVEGYADGWFGLRPGPLSDTYADGWEDGNQARKHFLKGGAR